MSSPTPCARAQLHTSLAPLDTVARNDALPYLDTRRPVDLGGPPVHPIHLAVVEAGEIVDRSSQRKLNNHRMRKTSPASLALLAQQTTLYTRLPSALRHTSTARQGAHERTTTRGSCA